MNIDLNLLTVFDAVMSEASLTRAAARLGKTQSAVSHSLNRLRGLTGDRLFERTGRGVRPTPRALDMEKEVRRALTIIAGALQAGGEFDPASEERTFLIDIPIGFDWVVAPMLANKLMEMPNITIRIDNSRAAKLLNALRYRETWLALDYMPLNAQGYRTETLIDHELVLVARTGHPRLAKGLDDQVLKALRQVGIGWSTDADPVNHPVDERVGEAGLPRHVRLWVPTLASMFAVVEATDLVAFCANRTAMQFAKSHDVRIYRLPVRLRTMPLIMVWHESFDNDAGHRWLRDTVRDICKSS